jgi:hypothetical protein
MTFLRDLFEEFNVLANSVNRQRMLVIDGNSEDDRQTEDKFREVNDRKQ